jgi:hypothetical protein
MQDGKKVKLEYGYSKNKRKIIKILNLIILLKLLVLSQGLKWNEKRLITIRYYDFIYNGI